MKERHRLLLGLIAVALLAAVLVGIGATRLVRSAVRERFVERVNAETALLASWIRDSQSGDLQALAVDAAGRLAVRVTVIDADGTVVADSARSREGLATMDDHRSRPEIVDAERRGTGESLRTSATTNEEYFYIARRVTDGGAARFVRIALPSSQVYEAQRAYGWAVVGVVTVSMLLLAAVAYGAVRRMSRPIERTTAAVERAAAGELQLDLGHSGGQELERLGVAVHRMQHALLGKIAELESERTVQASVVSGIKEGLLLLDPDQRVRLANAALRKIFELDFDPAGHPLPEVVRHPTVLELVQGAIDGTAEMPEAVFQIPGTGRSFELRVARLVGNEGKLEGVIVLLFDISRLEALERVRRDFVANVSHELRTPLTAIMASVESMIDDATQNPETRKRFLDIVRRNADHMGDLIEDLTDLSLIETGAVSLKMEEIDAAEVSDDVAERLRPVARSSDVSVEMELRRPFPLLADRRRLEQMLTNLVDNAIKFNRPGGHVRIEGRTHGGERPRLVVEDTGVGIPADSLDKVHNRFYQVSRERTGRGRGTGLGLAIVKHLMRLHGGRMRIESELNVGSKFTLEFPPPG